MNRFHGPHRTPSFPDDPPPPPNPGKGLDATLPSSLVIEASAPPPPPSENQALRARGRAGVLCYETETEPSFQSDDLRLERLKGAGVLDEEDLAWLTALLEAKRELAALEEELDACLGQLQDLRSLLGDPGVDPVRVHSHIGRVEAVVSALQQKIARVRYRLR